MVNRPIPKPKKDELLIKVSLAGICNTDLEISKGYLNFNGILGHEFVGKVVEDKSGIYTGKRVVGEINIPCYECYLCKHGKERHCKNIKVLGIKNKNGAFAEYLTLPRKNIWEVPDQITDLEAVFVEPLAAALQIPEQVHLKLTDKIIVLGDGKLGLLTSLVLSELGYDISLIGHHQSKLEIAAQKGIAVYTSGQYSPGANVVIDTTGSSSGLKDALKIVEPAGKIILKSTIAAGEAINLSPVAVDEIQIIGSRCGPFAPALRMLSRRNFPLQNMVDSVFTIDRILHGFERAKSKEVLKVLIKI